VTRYPDLREWVKNYRVAGTVGMTVVYRRER
jgi:hypothetical protein